MLTCPFTASLSWLLGVNVSQFNYYICANLHVLPNCGCFDTGTKLQTSNAALVRAQLTMANCGESGKVTANLSRSFLLGCERAATQGAFITLDGASELGYTTLTSSEELESIVLGTVDCYMCLPLGTFSVCQDIPTLRCL